MISLDQQPESQFGSRILEAASVAATLWPIAFAAVLGTALRSLALFTCEKGTTLGVSTNALRVGTILTLNRRLRY